MHLVVCLREGRQAGHWRESGPSGGYRWQPSPEEAGWSRETKLVRGRKSPDEGPRACMSCKGRGTLVRAVSEFRVQGAAGEQRLAVEMSQAGASANF